MVWGLFPVDPLPGEKSYHFCSKGTYKVGRKGCDVIINKDKGVSRIHAEVAIGGMCCVDQRSSSSTSSGVQIRDCSKYGTFISKSVRSKQNVNEFPNKETSLKDGDLISFGTGNASYRFCHVPLIFFVCSFGQLQAKQLLQDKISSIGACITSSIPECTHVLVDDCVSLTDEILETVVAKKQLTMSSWVEAIAEKSIYTELPSCSLYSPTLVCEGVNIKVAGPTTQENCLKDYTFFLESEGKYKFQKKLQVLLEVSGAKVVSAEQFFPTSQGVEDEGNRLVGVVPAGLKNNFGNFPNQGSVSRVNEIDLISAVLSGYLNPSILVSPPVHVSSSCSTDETIVADSDAEVETATSLRNPVPVHKIESPEHESKGERAACTVESSELPSKEKMASYRKEFADHDAKKATVTQTMKSSEDYNIEGDITSYQVIGNRVEHDNKSIEDRSNEIMAKIEKIDDDSETGNLDIIYSQDLIVRDTNFAGSTISFTNGAVANFKRFRKPRTQSGNSFYNLVPFSKYPYKDSDYGNEEVKESIKEEKKRKQIEAVAEDLFNNEKGRKRGVAGSMHALFSRS